MFKKLIDQSIGNLICRGSSIKGTKMRQLLLAQCLYYVNEELKKYFPKINVDDLRAVSVRGKSVIVDCAHAVLVQELRGKEKLILKILAEKMPQFSINAIRGQIRSKNNDYWE